MAWTRRSNESPQPDATLRLVISAKAAVNLLNNIRLFARAARLRPADNRPQLPACPKCYVFHDFNACTRRYRCGLGAVNSHIGPCDNTERCLNCHGPHPSSLEKCPARPRRENGIYARPDRAKLQSIRREGQKAWSTRHLSTPLSSPKDHTTAQTQAPVTAPQGSSQVSPSSLILFHSPTSRGHNEQTAQDLCIFQVNVGKSGSAHDAALQLAFQSGADLILIQEPWIFSDYSRRTTKTHPSFLTFAPLPDWSDCPQVMAYTRKGKGLSPFQPSTHSRDLIRVCIYRRERRMIDCCNIYNAPIGSCRPGEGPQQLFALAERPDILAGDFNLHHSAWNPTSRSDGPERETLLSWTTSKGLFLLNPPGVPTHDAGTILDLCFTYLGPNYSA
ncbi:hypothetical protein K3495_g11318 [Podosphaera aphanis]|nr:hypothetical protein K3495_g11318 [Podosphaera aphanis]